MSIDHSSKSALRLNLNTGMKHNANYERSVCAVFQVSVSGQRLRFHSEGSLEFLHLLARTFDKENCALCPKRSLAMMLHSDDVAQTLPF